jgi:hypothetical protein
MGKMRYAVTVRSWSRRSRSRRSRQSWSCIALRLRLNQNDAASLIHKFYLLINDIAEIEFSLWEDRRHAWKGCSSLSLSRLCHEIIDPRFFSHQTFPLTQAIYISKNGPNGRRTSNCLTTWNLCLWFSSHTLLCTRNITYRYGTLYQNQILESIVHLGPAVVHHVKSIL